MTIIRPVVIFLVSLYVLMLAVPLVEQVARGQAVTGLRGMYLPFVIGQPLLLATGYALGLRRRGGTVLHILAAVLAVVTLGVLSVFTQGAGRLFVVVACLAVGFLVGLAMSLRRQRDAAAAA